MITDNYIKMCEKAEEIQKLWIPKDGDWFYGYQWNDIGENGEISIYSKREIHLYYDSGDRSDSCFPIPINKDFDIDDEKIIPDLSKSCWLPTQEQLQEMMKDLANKRFFENFPKNYFPQKGEYVFPIYLLNWFTQWIIFEAKGMKEFSITELWFAFVMKEKYNKIWNGEDWIIENKENKNE
jgi:hypothetical protein